MPMTKQEAAAFLGKGPATVQWYAKMGRVQVVARTTGRNATVYYNAADIAQIAGKPLPSEYAGEQPSRPVEERPQGAMTLEEAATVLNRSVTWIKVSAVKAGIVRVIAPGRGRRPMLVDAEDVKKLAATLSATSSGGRGRPRKSERRNLFMCEGQEVKRGLLTDEVKRAGRRLIEALTQACMDARMTENEIEGGIAYLVANLGDSLEAKIWGLQRQR
jgi:hypothetical protein